MSHARKSFLGRAAVCLTAVLMALASACTPARSQAPSSDAASVAQLNADQIVTEMERHNQTRRADLKSYHSVRHYSVEYKGFSAKIAGQLVVEVDYEAGTGMSFRILSQSGSKLLVDKVLKRLVESEKDAQERRSADLTRANYAFHLAGMEDVDGRPAYVLDVQPLKDNIYLYRGKVWVDKADFALTRIEATPSKNPSFWISSTAIHHRYTRTGGFWLPAENRSDTKVRLGGKAVLAIDYGPYQVVPATPLVAGGS